jgi:hypothetical protein
MSEVKVSSVSSVSSIKPVEAAGAAPQDFLPREGQVYTAKVKGFAEGAALVSINDRFLLSLSDLAVKSGESILLKLIRRDADGKLIFKLVTGDNAAGRSLEASPKSAADILKSIGVDAKIPYSQNVLKSHLNFGLRLDARSIERSSSSLNKALEKAAGRPGDPQVTPELKDGALPQVKTAAAEGASALLKPGADIQLLSDAAVLLNKSGITFGPASLKLAAALLEKLRGGLDFNGLLSSRHSLLTEELAAVLPQLESLNKKAALAGARLLGYLKSSDAPGGAGASGLKIMAAFSRLAAEGGVPSENKSASALKDLFTLFGELDKAARGGDTADGSFKSGVFNQLRENIFSLLENRALIELYSALSGSELFKIPIDYEGESGEALCEIEKEDGRVAAVDIYLTLSKLDTVRINVKKKKKAAGIYIFVKNTAIKNYINAKYAENKELIDSAMKSRYYFTVVVGKKIDFMPPIIKYRVSGIPQTAIDVSA